jgi:hypothetical protein
MKWLKTLFSQNVWINAVLLTGYCLSLALAAYGFWTGLPDRIVGEGVFIIFCLGMICAGFLAKDFRWGHADGPPMSRNHGRALIVSMGLIGLCVATVGMLPEEAVRDFIHGFGDFTLPVSLSDRTLTGVVVAIMGLVVFLLGVFGRNFRGDYIQPMPTVLGKAIFVVIGLMFMAAGIGIILSVEDVGVLGRAEAP